MEKASKINLDEMDKLNTYVVIKREDIFRYLKGSEQLALVEMLTKIISGRVADNKEPVNNYYVVNKEEPFADKWIEAGDGYSVFLPDEDAED